MSPVGIQLVKTLDSLISIYNNNRSEINYTDLRNLQNYIEEQGFVIDEVRAFIIANPYY
jgi:hypothetical protein